MGFVYISREGNENRFTIGAAKSFAERKKGGYTRYNPRLKTYSILKTPDHFALEKFLHDELADKRIVDIHSTSWYVATPEEIDAAVDRAKTTGRAYLERKKQVAELKNSVSDGNWLVPNDRLREVYTDLSKISLELARLRRTEESLKLEVMAYIGTGEGVDGLFEWPSHEERRFQTKIFALKYPDLYEAFRQNKYVRRFKLWGGDVEEFDESDEDA
jgi:hypothetical protein